MSQDRGKCVLIVEDDPITAACLAELLQAEGYSTRMAEDGQKGLDLLRQGALPDLILLDLAMPIKDGAAFRAEQLEHASWRAIPTLILSADAACESKNGLFAACAYIAKPLDIYRLLRVVERRCG